MAATVSGVQRVTPRGAGGDGGDEPRGPGPQSALRRGDAAAEREAAGDSARGRVRDRLSCRRFPIGCGTTPSRTNGPISFACSAGVFMARAIATSPSGRPNSPAAAICDSSPATWADRVRCARFATARASRRSMGMSPQSGLPQNNRVGDFDPFALPLIIERTGKSLDEVLETLAGRSPRRQRHNEYGFSAIRPRVYPARLRRPEQDLLLLQLGTDQRPRRQHPHRERAHRPAKERRFLADLHQRRRPDQDLRSADHGGRPHPEERLQPVCLSRAM